MIVLDKGFQTFWQSAKTILSEGMKQKYLDWIDLLIFINHKEFYFEMLMIMKIFEIALY